MTSWISREEALKAAQVITFDAKRYLSIFYRFAPRIPSHGETEYPHLFRIFYQILKQWKWPDLRWRRWNKPYLKALPKIH